MLPAPPHARAHIQARTAVAAVGITTLSAMAPFLLGALQVYIRADAELGAGQMGLVIGTAFAVAMASSWPAGRLAGRHPERTAMLVAGALSACSLLVFALGPAILPVLLLGAVLAGLGSGAAQPPANAAIAQHIVVHRRGLVFGLKQSAIPTATLLASLAVPIFAEGPGWRWAFVAPVVLLGTGWLAPRTTVPERPPRSGWFGAVRRRHRTSLLLLASAGALGSAAANAMGAFLIDWSVVSGGSAVEGARLATLGSLCGIVTRVLVGALSDRLRSSVFRIVLAQLAAGSIGFLLISTGSFDSWTILGVVLAFAGGWGWTGLLAHLVTSLAPEDPATATGLSQLGVLSGSAAGPVLIGLAFAGGHPAFGWIACAAAGALAGVLVAMAGRRTQRGALLPGEDD